jgi:hypothetical protein
MLGRLSVLRVVTLVSLPVATIAIYVHFLWKGLVDDRTSS